MIHVAHSRIGDDDASVDPACQRFRSWMSNRKGRKMRRHELYPLVKAIPSSNTLEFDRLTIKETRCLLTRTQDDELSKVADEADAKLAELEAARNATRASPQQGAAAQQRARTASRLQRLSGAAAFNKGVAVGRHALGKAAADARPPRGRRLLFAGRQRWRRRMSSPPSERTTSATRTVTRGLGVFAGADFPCDERDAHVGAPWARGACLLKCAAASTPSSPRCDAHPHSIHSSHELRCECCCCCCCAGAATPSVYARRCPAAARWTSTWRGPWRRSRRRPP